MKKFLSLILALTMVASLAACGGSTEEATKEEEKTPTIEQSAPATSDKVWPDGTPTVYVGYGAGGGTDTAVRPVVAAMAEYLGENINVTNMEGANSSVACDYVLGEAHNGYNLFATGTGGFSSFPVYC